MACRSSASLLTPETDKVGGAPVGFRSAAMAPGHDAAPDPGPGPRGAARLNRRYDSRIAAPARLALLVGPLWRRWLRGGGDEVGDQMAAARSSRVAPELRQDQEPTGFNNHLQGQRHLGPNIVMECCRWPSTPPTPRSMNEGPARLGSEARTRRRSFKIKQSAVWSDGTPISADDFVYPGNLNGTIKDNDVPAPPATTRWRASGLRQRQDGHRGLQDPGSDWKGCLPGSLPPPRGEPGG
jgi:hypothetical protein